MSQDLTQRARSISTKVKWGIALVALLVISPIVFLVVKSLVGLAIIGVLGAAIINFAPLVSMKFANWKLKGIKAEARANPIETRQQVALDRRARLADVGEQVKNFGAEVRNVGDQVKDLRKNNQAVDADELEVELVKLEKDFDDQVSDLEMAKTALLEFEGETIRLGRRWKAAEALLRARGASGIEVSQELQKLVSQEATDAVNTKMNLAFASLDVDRASRRQHLQHNIPQTIDVSAVEIRERLHA